MPGSLTTMPNCRTCGSPLSRSPDGLLRCKVCGFTFKPNQNQPLLANYVPKAMAPIQVPDADHDLRVFINRVGEKVVPIHADYTPAIKKSLTYTRSRVKKELAAVFGGKQTFDKWFTKTRRDLAIHQIDLTQILYDSLEGLQSREARDMRKQYEQALLAIKASYNPAGVGSVPA